MDKKSLEVKYNHYEEKRKEKLRIAKEEKVILLDEEKKGIWFYDENG